MKDNSNISQELLESVERYYNNTMSKQEHLDFELRKNEDSEFKSQVEDIKTLILGIENQSLKEQLNAFHEDLPDEDVKTSPVSSFFTFRKIAASIAILLAISSFWLFSKPQNEKLYSEYFSPDPGLPTVMSSNSNFQFYDAMVNYKQGDYKTAIAKWENLQKTKPNNDTLNYFMGVTYLAENKSKKAISYLEKTASKAKSVFNTDANYYLGLAYLKEGDIENSIKYLKLSNNENSLELLKKID